jgi:D-glycero-alpha-D-manno-heptose-7-phosphate kinase
MIISKTPFRISFVGGGTDYKNFFSKFPGAVVSTAINKYIYVAINKKFDHKIRVSYSKTENVDKVSEIEHPLVREALKMTKIDGGIEITSIADIPSSGTGLGSSSSFLVGLLNVLYAYKGLHVSAERLAKEAYEIEAIKLKEPVGKQDQYIAAYGGFKYIQFNQNDTVFTDPIICKEETKKKLQKNLLILYTGITRKAKTVLKEQNLKTKKSNNQEILNKMAKLAKDLQESLINNDLNVFGNLLHSNWLLKKQLASLISNPQIDKWYEIGLKNGAIGGKILGAGGGGFLLFYAEQKNHAKIKNALNKLTPFSFSFEPQGSRIIYVG